MSFSPELFFKKEDTSCTVRPMKGTISRGLTPEADAQLKDFLRHDPKNCSENIMIVDLLRNDLGRVCRQGSVNTESLFDVETYETLHQMTSTINGTISDEAGLEDIFHSLFPCGSVTGAPKIRTMEIIHELESAPRDIYTGAIGFITPAREMKFNVPIRTLLLAGNKGEMGIGSGVVYDSDPEKEWEECQLKGRFLSNPSPAFQLIETILWQPDSGYWLLDEHLERLENSAAYFGFHFNRRTIIGKLLERAGDFATVPQRVRLTLDKDGTIALSASTCTFQPMTTLPERAAAEALPCARFANETADMNSPYIYHKTTRRDLYDRERKKAMEDGCLEVLFANARGEVTEGSITNIFILQEGKILTPPLDSGLLNGVFRRYFLKNCPLPIEEKILLPKDLEQAEAVYLGNSVRGLVEVRVRKD
jgi:para-aminobenzoate synthetase/4-amino-4-deoxychorismate lyase